MCGATVLNGVVNVNKVSMVYDADSGLRGEVSYVFGMMKGRHCALCDISHKGVRKKSSFEDLTCTLAMPVEVLHRNQQDPALAAFTEGMGAVVVAHGDEGFTVLLDDAALVACGGDVDCFGDALRASLAKVGAPT